MSDEDENWDELTSEVKIEVLISTIRDGRNKLQLPVEEVKNCVENDPEKMNFLISLFKDYYGYKYEYCVDNILKYINDPDPNQDNQSYLTTIIKTYEEKIISINFDDREVIQVIPKLITLLYIILENDSEKIYNYFWRLMNSEPKTQRFSIIFSAHLYRLTNSIEVCFPIQYIIENFTQLNEESETTEFVQYISDLHNLLEVFKAISIPPQLSNMICSSLQPQLLILLTERAGNSFKCDLFESFLIIISNSASHDESFRSFVFQILASLCEYVKSVSSPLNDGILLKIFLKITSLDFVIKEEYNIETWEFMLQSIYHITQRSNNNKSKESLIIDLYEIWCNLFKFHINEINEGAHVAFRDSMAQVKNEFIFSRYLMLEKPEKRDQLVVNVKAFILLRQIKDDKTKISKKLAQQLFEDHRTIAFDSIAKFILLDNENIEDFFNIFEQITEQSSEKSLDSDWLKYATMFLLELAYSMIRIHSKDPKKNLEFDKILVNYIIKILQFMPNEARIISSSGEDYDSIKYPSKIEANERIELIIAIILIQIHKNFAYLENSWYKSMFLDQFQHFDKMLTRVLGNFRNSTISAFYLKIFLLALDFSLYEFDFLSKDVINMIVDITKFDFLFTEQARKEAKELLKKFINVAVNILAENGLPYSCIIYDVLSKHMTNNNCDDILKIVGSTITISENMPFVPEIFICFIQRCFELEITEKLQISILYFLKKITSAKLPFLPLSQDAFGFISEIYAIVEKFYDNLKSYERKYILLLLQKTSSIIYNTFSSNLLNIGIMTILDSNNFVIELLSKLFSIMNEQIKFDISTIAVTLHSTLVPKYLRMFHKVLLTMDYDPSIITTDVIYDFIRLYTEVLKRKTVKLEVILLCSNIFQLLCDVAGLPGYLESENDLTIHLMNSMFVFRLNPKKTIPVTFDQGFYTIICIQYGHFNELIDSYDVKIRNSQITEGEMEEYIKNLKNITSDMENGGNKVCNYIQAAFSVLRKYLPVE